MSHYVVIVAGGSGKRMQSNLPKQFIEIKGKPIIFHTIEKFLAFDINIHFVIALQETYIGLFKDLYLTHKCTFRFSISTAGKERFHTVKAALEGIPLNSIVGIHDAVRPFVNIHTIKNCYEGASIHEAVVPVIPVVDTIRNVEGNSSKTLNRSSLRAVQTPQYFRSNIIKQSYNVSYSSIFTDDASVVEYNGGTIYLVDGNPENIKITSPMDLKLASLLS